MKKKMASRVISMLLITVMLFTMTGVSAFAEETDDEPEETKNLLVFGASTSSGYGLSNFFNKNRGFAVDNNDLTKWTYEYASTHYGEGGFWKGRMSEDSYPWKLKKYIADTEFGGDLDKVNLAPLAFNGMRTNELRAYLDPEYAVAAFDLENRDVPTGKGFYVEHVQSIVDCMGDGGAMVDMEDGNGPVRVWKSGEDKKPGSTAYMRAHKYVEDEIKKADVIVVDVCMNNFGTYLANRVAAIYGIPGFEGKEGFGDQKPEDIIGASPELINRAKKLKETMKKMVPMLSSNDNIDVLIDAFIYCYVDCITNLSEDVKMIKALKKDDAKVIVVGVYNTLDGITTEIGGQKYEFGEIASYGFKMLNTHIKAMDENSDFYYYVDVQDNIETFMNQLVMSESYEELTSTPEGNSVMDKFYHGGDSFYDLFLRGNEWSSDPDDDPGSFLNQFREPAKKLLYRGAKKVDLHMDELMANLANLYSPTGIGAEIALYFTAVGGYRNIPSSYPGVYDSLTDAQKVEITSYFVDQKMQNKSDNDAMTAAITGFAFHNYAFSNDDNKAIAQSCAYWGTTADGADEDEAAAGIGVTADKKDEIPSFPSESSMELMQILDRFIVYQGIGQHPSKDGCESMFQDVKTAYIKSQTGGNTAYGDFKDDLEALFAQYRKMFEGTPLGDDIDNLVEMKDHIQELMPLIDEAMPLLERMDEILALMDRAEKTMDEVDDYKAKLNEFYGFYKQVLNALGVSEEDVIQNAKLITEDIDAETVAGWIKQIYDIAQKYPELRDKYEPLIRDYAEDILDLVDKTMDTLIKQKEFLDENGIEIDWEQVKRVIIKMNDFIKEMPDLYEKYQPIFQKDAKEILDMIEKAIDTLKAQKEFLEENGIEIDMRQVADAIVAMNDLIKAFPEMKAKYEPLIREYASDIYEIIDKTVKEIVKNKEMIEDAIDVEKIAEFIRTAKDVMKIVKDVYNNMPTQQEIMERVRAEINKQLDKVQEIVEAKAAEISEELLAKIKEISDMIKDATDGKDFDEIIEELQPLFEELKEIGLAVYQLPEYEKLIDSYAGVIDELSEAAANLQIDVATLSDQAAELQEQADALQSKVGELEGELAKFQEQVDQDAELIAKLKAKSISVSIKTKVTFPKNKAKLTVTWKKDDDAAGYKLVVNGEQKEFTETATGFQYVDTTVQIGETYKIEITPSATYGRLAASGKTFEKSVKPKVTLKKAVIKKVKAGKNKVTVKWKKVSGASGYKISYKVGKNKTRYKTIKGGKKIKATIKKLTSGKKCKVKVRAWKKVNGKKYYGKWSKAKTVKVK